jgi:hypothetical protein
MTPAELAELETRIQTLGSGEPYLQINAAREIALKKIALELIAEVRRWHQATTPESRRYLL